MYQKLVELIATQYEESSPEEMEAKGGCMLKSGVQGIVEDWALLSQMSIGSSISLGALTSLLVEFGLGDNNKRRCFMFELRILQWLHWIPKFSLQTESFKFVGVYVDVLVRK